MTSTAPGNIALAEIPANDRRLAWTEQYEAAYPVIFETYHSAWGRHERCLAAAADVPDLVPRVPALEARARALLEDAERSFRTDGLLDDLDVVLLVGGRTSNGWVTEFRETVTLFLALEFLGDAPYDEVLVSHEAFHVAHSRHGSDEWPEDGAAALFSEGLATAMSREIRPGLDDTAYLWFDNEHAAWVATCESAGSAIVARTLEQLTAPYAEPAVRGLFTTHEGELPPRAGYWLGDVVVCRLLERHPPAELLRWDHATVVAALREELPTIRS